MHKISTIILLLVLSALFAACSKETRDPCLFPREAPVRVRCSHVVDSAGTFADTALPNPLIVPLESQTLYAFGGQKRLSSFPLTLSGVVDSCRWVLRPDSASAVADTVSFYYQRQLHFISNACGYTYYYHLDRVSTTRHAIDSSVILKADVTTDAGSDHLRLIF